MKASYNWLKDYCDFDLPAHELAERLSHTGLGVESYEPHGDDWMLDVEVKCNRPDCLCHLGIAREVAAITGGKARRPGFDLPEDLDQAVDDAASVEVTAPDLCPHYTARVIKGIRVGPSPAWLQERLTVCGLRPVNNVVDATNFVMLECGQPLHAFDLARIGGARIIVRRSRPGEVLTTIDGSEHELSGQECVIADQFKPVALGGVMGGLDSEISEGTTDVLIEAARFASTSIRKTSRAHGLASDSSYRYERGVDPEITDWASRRVCALILELAGGTLFRGVAEVRTDSTCLPEVTLRLARLALVLGIEVPHAEVLSILEGLGLEVLDQSDEAVTVRLPSWRADLSREIDLIEEVARIHGYDKIGETTQMAVRSVTPTVGEVAERRARRLLAGEGFSEVMTYSLVQPTLLQLAQPWHDGEPLPVRNPVSTERTHLRLTNMANLLLVKQLNQSLGTWPVDLFELGAIYLPRQGKDVPEEKLALSVLTDRHDGVRILKGVLDNLLDELGIEGDVSETLGCAGPFEANGAVRLLMDGAVLGCAGLAAARHVKELDLRNRPALLEVDFHLLADRCRLDPSYRPLSAYPGTRRDIAAVVDEEVLWAQIEKCVTENAPETLERIEFFDVYRGDPVPEGRKSVAFSLTFRRRDRTITAEEAEAARSDIVAALGLELGAMLR